MRRREFLGVVSGALTWSAAATAQQSKHPRRVGAFLYLKEQDSESKAYTTAFENQLATLGWRPGVNVEINYRWTGGDAGPIRQYAAELASLRLTLSWRRVALMSDHCSRRPQRSRSYSCR
jgi:hypothetical protein